MRLKKNRLSKKREKARSKQQPFYRVRRLGKSAAKRIRKLTAPSLPRGLDPAFTEKYGHGDFYYRRDNLDTALDLLAVCSDDADALTEARQKLETA